MASIFSYDSEPPRVASPWTGSPKSSTPVENKSPDGCVFSSVLADYGVTRLEAEPQEGPTEYKLHLLLRPRRNYSSSSTSCVNAGSQQNNGSFSAASDGAAKETITVRDVSSTTVLAASARSKQRRLEQLTTQLLWRLQQSSPYHETASSSTIIPRLPTDSESLDEPPKPEVLIAGLEESRGALYEIGVSDDGTFVGLTKDEMDESLRNLRVMAASLGCFVRIAKMVIVGECEWVEGPAHAIDITALRKRKPWLNPEPMRPTEGSRQQGQLFVAEALVVPDLSLKRTRTVGQAKKSPKPKDNRRRISIDESSERILTGSEQATDQLRITLTGATTSGKSSLLGTLSTGTLDNGRGKSRLSLLKHRHEIESGVTSSITQEIFGFDHNGMIVNWASANVSSWINIHASAKGRLVFVSDSAGHPRYRRTTIRGLVGWAPHWSVLCLAGDDSETSPSGVGGTSSAQDILGAVGAGLDLPKAHLELCLKLNRPLLIVITKLDLASRTSMTQAISKVLAAVKATGRTPTIVSPDQAKNILDSELGTPTEDDETAVRSTLDSIKAAPDLRSVVPIVLTSAAKGTGIRQLLALLRQLPIPKPPRPQALFLNPEQPACLFHIEEVYGVPASFEESSFDTGSVMSGHLRFGNLSVGDAVVLGPFLTLGEDLDSSPAHARSRSSPGSLGKSLYSSSADGANLASREPHQSVARNSEWQTAHIVSIRNLRLPVTTLEAGQVGTIGLRLESAEVGVANGSYIPPKSTLPRIRKGMVMAVPSQHMIQTGHTLQAASSFTASFDDGDINSLPQGSLVVIYIASIRASARVVRLKPNVPTNTMPSAAGEDVDEVFGPLDRDDQEADFAEPLIFGSDGITDVTFELVVNREWIELGSQVLVMPGGGHGLYHGSERGEKGIASLEGFSGIVVEVVD